MEKYNFDLDEEIIKDLSEEFNPQNFVKDLKLPNPMDFEAMTVSFQNYGRDLARTSIILGEKKPDRTYEVMKQAIAKTGEMKFPLVPQRYIEIAYLSTQPFKRLWVISNNPKVFSYRLKECNIYQAIRQKYGEEVANKMVCKSACFAILNETFSHFGLDIEFSLETGMADAGSCQFRIEKK
jgi:hypothetical protein